MNVTSVGQKTSYYLTEHEQNNFSMHLRYGKLETFHNWVPRDPENHMKTTTT